MEKKVLGILAIVFGGIGLLGSWIPIINNVSFFFGLIGVLFGIIALIVNRKNKKVLAIVGTVLSVISMVIVLATQSMYGKALDEATGTSDAKTEQADKAKTSDKKVFANNTLTADDAVIQYEKAVVANEKDYDGKTVIYYFFKVTNNGDDAEDGQMFLLNYVDFKQNLGSTTANLDYGMLSNDQFPDQTAVLNQQINPGSTVELAYPIVSQDDTKPVIIEFSPDMFSDVAGKIEVPVQ
jgi:hypothetical protein